MNPYESGYPTGSGYPPSGGGYFPGALPPSAFPPSSHMPSSAPSASPLYPAPSTPPPVVKLDPPSLPPEEPGVVKLAPPSLPPEEKGTAPSTPTVESKPISPNQQSGTQMPAAAPAVPAQQVVHTPAFTPGSQQSSLATEYAGRSQQASLAVPKSKKPLIIVVIALAVVAAIIAVVLLSVPSSYTITITNQSMTPGLESFSVKSGNNNVYSGQQLRDGTEIIISWQTQENFEAVLWINGVETGYESGEKHIVVGDIEIKITTIEKEPPPIPEPTHWSDPRIAKESWFYKRYYPNDQLVRPPNGYLEIREAADWGAVSYVSAQDALAEPFKQTFSGLTLVLTKNIDMSEYLWSPIVDFRGAITGGGYTVSGLKFDPVESDTPSFYAFGQDGVPMLEKNKNAAFISSVQGDVVIRDLTLRGSIVTSTMPTLVNQTIRGLRTNSTTMYSNHSSVPTDLRGQLVGADRLVSNGVANALNPLQIAGYTSAADTTWTTVSIRRAFNAAGFVAEILSDGAKLGFFNCVNYVDISSSTASISDTSDAFGFLASSRSARMIEGNSGLPSTANLLTDDIAHTARTGVYFDKCVNYGNFNMQLPNYGAGGLAAAATSIIYSANYGSITAVAGYVGGLTIGMNTRHFSIRYSYNYGTLHLSGSESGGGIGGLAFGHVQTATNGVHIYIRDSANYGALICRARSGAAVGGLLAQYNCSNISGNGRLYIQNCLSIGSIEMVEGIDANNYFAGLVAKTMGNGQVRIQVAFVNTYETHATRGSAAVDYISDTLFDQNDNYGLSTRLQIRGVVYRGSAPLTRWNNPGSVSFRNFENCGQVTDQAGTIVWDRRELTGAFTLADKSNSPMLSGDGVMELLKREYLNMDTNPLKWFSHADLGNWGMYLQFSTVSIASYDASKNAWNTPTPVSADGGNVFVHRINNPSPGNNPDWIFAGYSTASEGIISFPKETSVTPILAFGATVLYEKWTH